LASDSDARPLATKFCYGGVVGVALTLFTNKFINTVGAGPGNALFYECFAFVGDYFNVFVPSLSVLALVLALVVLLRAHLSVRSSRTGERENN
jgi:hypothetical protein